MFSRMELSKRDGLKFTKNPYTCFLVETNNMVVVACASTSFARSVLKPTLAVGVEREMVKSSHG